MRLQVQSLASLSGLSIQRCRELWCLTQTRSDHELLWLQPLAWEPPSTLGTGMALKKKDKKKSGMALKKKDKKKSIVSLGMGYFWS